MNVIRGVVAVVIACAFAAGCSEDEPGMRDDQPRVVHMTVTQHERDPGGMNMRLAGTVRPSDASVRAAGINATVTRGRWSLTGPVGEEDQVEVIATRPGYRRVVQQVAIDSPRLEGTWDVTIRDVEAESILGGATTVQRLWEFEPLCRQGACDVELVRQVQEEVHQMQLRHAGTRYAGSDSYTLATICDDGSQVDDATLWRNRFRIEVTDWNREAGELIATRLRARLVSVGTPTEAGLASCSEGGRLISVATGRRR